LSDAPFVAVGGVCEQLGIGRSTLQNIFPYLPHVSFSVSSRSGRETRLFPALYIRAYAHYLHLGRTKATIPTAQSFAATRAAQQIITEVQQALEAAISERQTHTPNQVAAMFGIGRATITGWERAGVFHVDRQAHQPVRRRNDGIQVRQFIPAAEVRQAARWVLP
jgi:hypothetical protein